MNHLKRDNQKGFTIVELVVVIIILGILAATALPRFLDVSDEAHVAVVENTAGNLDAAMGLWKAHWVANNKPASATIDGATLFFNASTGYPLALTAATWEEDECDDLFTALIRTPILAIADAGSAVDDATSLALTSDVYDWYVEDSSASPTCVYLYAGRGNVTGSTVNVNTTTGAVTTTLSFSD